MRGNLITSHKAEAIAKKALVAERNVDMTHYELVSVKKRNDDWVVFFSAKEPWARPGAHFFVWVNEKTGNSKISDGE